MSFGIVLDQRYETTTTVSAAMWRGTRVNFTPKNWVRGSLRAEQNHEWEGVSSKGARGGGGREFWAGS